MTLSASLDSFDSDLDLNQVYLDIDPAVAEQAWQQSQRLATPASRWRAYLNELGLRSLLPWLNEGEILSARVRPMLASALWPTVWEWVAGSAVDLMVGRNEQALRLVLMATDDIDADELRVPKEWVDIASWVGDYYLLLQVNPDDGWVKLVGCATHAALKTTGVYDWQDRTYALNASELITDINVIGISQALAPESVKRAVVEPIGGLSAAQAGQLMTRLSPASVLNPRLAVDFHRWSALMAHGGWRRQMAMQRWGQPSAFAVSQWLRSGVTQLAEQLGWQSVSFESAAVGARGTETDAASGADALEATGLSRAISIDGEAHMLQILPLAEVADNAWRFELRRLNGLITPETVLRLLSEDLQPFENSEVSAAEPAAQLFVDVALASGEGIVWEIAPQPDQYEPEILRF